jgi:hypothetical protein
MMGLNKTSASRVKALIVKEFFQIIRDPSSLALATIFPLFTFMYGYGISLDVNNLNVGLVLREKSESINSFVSSLEILTTLPWTPRSNLKLFISHSPDLNWMQSSGSLLIFQSI